LFPVVWCRGWQRWTCIETWPICALLLRQFLFASEKRLSASLVLTYDTREVKYHVYSKRKSRICTTGKFPLQLLLFTVHYFCTESSVVSHNFLCIRIFRELFLCALTFSILRNSQLEWTWRLPFAVFGKGRTWICTTWPSFQLTCRLYYCHNYWWFQWFTLSLWQWQWQYWCHLCDASCGSASNLGIAVTFQNSRGL